MSLDSRLVDLIKGIRDSGNIPSKVADEMIDLILFRSGRSIQVCQEVEECARVSEERIDALRQALEAEIEKHNTFEYLRDILRAGQSETVEELDLAMQIIRLPRKYKGVNII